MKRLINNPSIATVVMTIVFFSFIFTMNACTENARVKEFGGTATVELKEGQRLVNVTWKENNLWVLTKKDTTPASTYHFKEKSSLGITEGEYIIKEK